MILKNSFVAKFKETSGVTQDIYDDAFNDGKNEGLEQGKQEGFENAKNHLEEKRITKNGVYVATEPNFGFSKVEVRVDIPPDYVNPEGTVEITENGTHNVEHFEFAEVNVPVPEGYIKPQGILEITKSGTYDVTGYSTVIVTINSSEDEPTFPKLSAPVIRLETQEDSSSDEEISTSAVLGEAVLGYAVLGCRDGNIPKLATPAIRLETVGEEMVQKLATPIIYVEVEEELLKLDTPVINIEEEIDIYRNGDIAVYTSVL